VTYFSDLPLFLQHIKGTKTRALLVVQSLRTRQRGRANARSKKMSATKAEANDRNRPTARTATHRRSGPIVNIASSPSTSRKPLRNLTSSEENIQKLSSESTRSSSSSSSSSSLADDDGDKEKDRKQPTFLTHLVSGFCGGALSRTVSSPLNVIQVRKMTNRLSAQARVIPSMVKIAKTEGFRTLFAGNTTMVLRFGPSKGLNFATFHFFNVTLHKMAEERRKRNDAKKGSVAGDVDKRKKTDDKKKSENGDIGIKMIAGALCGVSACLLLYPLDAYATRKAAGKITESFTGPFSVALGIQSVVKNEGISGIYRGLSPALLAIAPEAALTFGTYDIVADWYKKKTNKEYLEPHISMTVGALSATVGQLAAFPMELIARKAATNRFSLPLHGTFYLMVKNRGVGSLYKGAKVAASKCVPMSAVSFATYEFVKHLILHYDIKLLQ
jgi:solute carrier family 25 (mitochondrial phosphate transporter), member 23/24/25/41